jgi:thiamine biosynthesis lipoprotein
MARWRTLQFDFTAMASPCSVQLDGVDERAMRMAAHAAIAEVQRIEHKYSRYRADSVVCRINANAGQAPILVDSETFSLLQFADKLWSQSDGLFDITSGVLRRAWDFKTAQLPTQGALDALLPLVGWNHVALHADSTPALGGGVRLRQPGMELDFGGFGKEYAADRAAAVLMGHGLRHALVNLGGDLHALDSRGLPDLAGQPWHIAITHPRPKDGTTVLARQALAAGGLATSGDYERFFIRDGQRYCHVLNPTTGWPVTDWQSVSILAPTTTAAGALSTIAMLKGKQAPEWLDAQGAHYLMADHNGGLFQSPPSTS